MAEQDPAVLRELFDVIRQRQRERPEGSYVARLLSGAPDAVLRKVTEEAGETVLAAKDLAAITSGPPGVTAEAGQQEALAELVHELADLWFHSLVLLAWAGGELDEILAELARRRR